MKKENKVRMDALTSVRQTIDDEMTRFAKLRCWVAREIERYRAEWVFESQAVKDAKWYVVERNVDHMVTLETFATPPISRLFPGDMYHEHIYWGELVLSLSDNYIYLQGPTETMRDYIISTGLNVNTRRLDKVIADRRTALESMVAIRDQIKGKQ